MTIFQARKNGPKYTVTFKAIYEIHLVDLCLKKYNEFR